MKRLFWLGLIANEFFHAVVAGGQTFQLADSLGLGSLSELSDAEVYSLLSAINLKGVLVGPGGKANVVDANEGGTLPIGAIPLKTFVWLHEYKPDRASTIRNEEPKTIAAEEAEALREIAAARAAEDKPVPVVIPETPAQ